MLISKEKYDSILEQVYNKRFGGKFARELVMTVMGHPLWHTKFWTQYGFQGSHRPGATKTFPLEITNSAICKDIRNNKVVKILERFPPFLIIF